jgi:YggT family protein
MRLQHDFTAWCMQVVPLVGGVDVTPIIWVGLLSLLSEILIGPQVRW